MSNRMVHPGTAIEDIEDMARLTVTDYRHHRQAIKAGDVIAFGGKGRVSNLIKTFTRSAVSHVGIVLRTSVPGDSREFVEVIESTTLDGVSGVTRVRLSTRLEHYKGEIWHLPIRRELMTKPEEFFNFLFAQDGKEYDTIQAMHSALDYIVKESDEDFSKFFCSELASAGLEAAGVLPKHNSSEVTPIDLCRVSIYEDNYYQLSGDPKEIKGFNKLNPISWSLSLA